MSRSGKEIEWLLRSQRTEIFYGKASDSKVDFEDVLSDVDDVQNAADKNNSLESSP